MSSSQRGIEPVTYVTGVQKCSTEFKKWPAFSTRPRHHPQARAHDGRRRDGDERAGQGLGVHRASAGRRAIPPSTVGELFRVRNDAPNGGDQRLELDRFGFELVAARGNGFLALVRYRICGHANDRDVAGFGHRS